MAANAILRCRGVRLAEISSSSNCVSFRGIHEKNQPMENAYSGNATKAGRCSVQYAQKSSSKAESETSSSVVNQTGRPSLAFDHAETSAMSARNTAYSDARIGTDLK